VREAAIRGLPGIALSHYIARGRPIDWPRATQWASRVLRRLMALPCEPGTFWNVNLPHTAPGAPEPDIVLCSLDPSPLPSAFHVEGNKAIYKGDYQTRARLPQADVSVCFGGQISVSLIRVSDSTPDRPLELLLDSIDDAADKPNL
jgi:5'-nucleotidase